MMILCKSVGTEINFDICRCHTLVLENKVLLRNITYSFYHETPEDYFVFSEHYEPFEFRKKGIYISNAIGFDMNYKRLISKVHSELEHTLVEELYEELFDVKSRLAILSEKLMQKSDFHFDCTSDISPHEIIKLFDVELTRQDDNFADDLIRYIQLLKQYLGVSFVVVSDLHSFFSKEELDLIFQTLILNEVCILCIEGAQPSAPSQYEKIHIIDHELCEME